MKADFLKETALFHIRKIEKEELKKIRCLPIIS